MFQAIEHYKSGAKIWRRHEVWPHATMDDWCPSVDMSRSGLSLPLLLTIYLGKDISYSWKSAFESSHIVIKLVILF